MKVGYLPGVKNWYNNKLFEESDNFDGRKAPFIELKSILEKNKIKIKTLDESSEKFDILIIHRIDINLGLLLRYLLINPFTILIYVVTEEPAIVQFHQPQLLKIFNFNFVLIYNTDNIPYFIEFIYPNPKLVYQKKLNFNERLLISAIVRHKKSNNYFRNSLYKMRNNYIKSLMTIDKFHLFGSGWRFNQKNYFGAIRSKNEVLVKYKYSLVIENSITDYFLTEKILDCMSQGSVPVYYGCKFVSNFVPENCFIKLDPFLSTPNLLIDYLEKIPEEKWIEINTNIETFFQSSNYSNLTSDKFVNIILDITKQKGVVCFQSALKLWINSIYIVLRTPQHLLTKSGVKMLLDIIIFPTILIKNAFKNINT